MIKTVASSYFKKYGIILKNQNEIEKMRVAGKMAAQILHLLCEAAKEGITTLELDELSRKLHKLYNAKPACLHYGTPPFPATICTSLNEVICHGIPSDRPLIKGDILNIDVACIIDGYYGDCSRMVMIGDVGQEKENVSETARLALEKSIAILGPGVKLSKIGDTIQSVADERNCSVVYQFVGHGVGRHFHEEPSILHYRHNPKVDIELAPGMTFTIEPMINGGKPEAVISKEDGWTATTIDGKPSAQWEHTLLITPHGYEILTQ